MYKRLSVIFETSFVHSNCLKLKLYKNYSTGHLIILCFVIDNIFFIQGNLDFHLKIFFADHFHKENSHPKKTKYLRL